MAHQQVYSALSITRRSCVALTSLALLLPSSRITAFSVSSNTKMSESVSTKLLADTSSSYEKALQHLNTVAQLERVSAVLGYDEVVFMPHSEDTSKERGLQKAALASVIHEKATDVKLGEWLEQAQADLDGGSITSSIEDERDARSILKLARKAYQKSTRVPPELVAREASLASQAYTSWVKARKNNDFESFCSDLTECFDMARAMAEAKRDSDDIPHYDEMLDQFEVGMPSSRINELFETVKGALVPLIQRVSDNGTKPITAPLEGHFPIPVQEELSKTIVTALGFDTDHGRIDVSVHPFTTSFSPKDVRITSRFKDTEWYQGLAGSVHECGHAMYEQNLNNSGLKIDSALSMGMHESQSLFWERHVGLSKPFWKWAAPMLNDKFENTYSANDYYGAVNALSQTLIRVEADELAYPLHVILRYGIERDIIEGTLKLKDLPTRWKQDMKSLLDLDVPDDNDTQGCLQDVHWASLAVGYFPTYLIGSMTAAQLAHYCQEEFPNMEQMIESGEFAPIKEWLTKKVHRWGSRYDSLDAHLEAELGEKLNPKYFIEYLTTKYTELYKC